MTPGVLHLASSLRKGGDTSGWKLRGTFNAVMAPPRPTVTAAGSVLTPRLSQRGTSLTANMEEAHSSLSAGPPPEAPPASVR